MERGWQEFTPEGFFAFAPKTQNCAMQITMRRGTSLLTKKQANTVNSLVIQWACHQSELDLTCKIQCLACWMEVWQSCFSWKPAVLVSETNSYSFEFSSSSCTLAPPTFSSTTFPFRYISDSSMELPCSQNPSLFGCPSWKVLLLTWNSSLVSSKVSH